MEIAINKRYYHVDAPEYTRTVTGLSDGFVTSSLDGTGIESQTSIEGFKASFRPLEGPYMCDEVLEIQHLLGKLNEYWYKNDKSVKATVIEFLNHMRKINSLGVENCELDISSGDDRRRLISLLRKREEKINETIEFIKENLNE